MTAATGAGTIYAFIVFLICFILGTIRVLVLRRGGTTAALLEGVADWNPFSPPFLSRTKAGLHRRALE